MSSNRIRVLLLSLLAVFAVSAVASASASAFNLKWEVNACKNEGAENGEFSDANCEVPNAGGGEFSETGALGELAAGRTRQIVSEGGAFTLTSGTKKVECTGVESEGTITGGAPGKDLASEIEYTGCKTNETGCLVKSQRRWIDWDASSFLVAGKIELSEIPTVLVEDEPGGGGLKKLADEFKENATRKEFVTLEFGKKEVTRRRAKILTEACTNFPHAVKVTGQVTAEVVGAEKNKLKFPIPPLKKNNLKFGVAGAELSGEITNEGAGGGKASAV